ncbi:hypothetical protein [Flavobacterium sp. N3904]|uniref:hypothetical protein n=1 Tax=Flavobacterium sp. N3904 TaxID=2986835 RepID=UPI002224BB97|nr:hypothetical protein [Flavobacterium sp. N3904]
MKKLYYFGHSVKGSCDGGSSRNKAFRSSFLKKKAIMVPIYNTNLFIRFGSLLNVLRIMILSKDNILFIHQGTLIFLFPISILKFSWIRVLVFKLIQHTVNRNDVTIEVNDLPYEQAIDLELFVEETHKIFQDQLYALKNAKYVFASHEMGKYVYDTFKLNYKVIINGSNEINESSDSGKIHECFNSTETKFIYAGSLNKGRQIEALISIFSNRKEILILIGEWGEWMLDYKLSSNIFYLGKFQEEHAHYLTSKCDVGIIPYDETRFYYNICYPTKASFYITAGIPFLSTPLLELKNVFEDSGIVYFVPFKEWESFINDFDIASFFDIKKRIKNEKYKFYWNDLLN